MKRWSTTILVLGLVTAGGCDSKNSARTFFGAANVRVQEATCAGKIALSQGGASVHDSCFSGDTNVVLCTNETHPNPVRCKASAGILTVEGSGEDVIDYARIR
jgi:hypothetical protein